MSNFKRLRLPRHQSFYLVLTPLHSLSTTCHINPSCGRFQGLADNTFRYLASTRECRPCPLKDRCCPNTRRKVPRDIYERVRDHVHALAETPAFKRSRNERKKVEMAFANMRRIFKLDRLRLRGLSGARDEVLLTATAQNLRKLARYAWRPPPNLKTV